MTNDGEEMRCLSLEGHSDSVRAVAFSPDGKQLVSGSDNCKVRLWDAATGAPPQTLDGHVSSVCAVAFLPDAKQLASGSDDCTIKLWERPPNDVFNTQYS